MPCMHVFDKIFDKIFTKKYNIQKGKKQFLINAITMPDPVYQYNARAFLFCVL